MQHHDNESGQQTAWRQNKMVAPASPRTAECMGYYLVHGGKHSHQQAQQTMTKADAKAARRRAKRSRKRNR
jgi:hypothetical protein